MTATLLPEVSTGVLEQADQHRDRFIHADPFKHVVIEDFFEPAFAEQLLQEFPKFDDELAIAETGLKGQKAVNTNIRSISPAYRRLYETLSGRPFLDFASRLSGIPDLLLDPKMFGGGTHENRHGQELDAHVDFNYDESRQLHRRLNLIVYLNKEWKTEWGGAIEIHSNPRDPYQNRIRSFDPLFNRCVMFETNEYSWHGFPKIELPEERRHLSRKSISIYLYTRQRPSNEVVPEHGTFYVQRPLPGNITAGYTLKEQDVDALRRLLIRRDTMIELYQKMELRKNGEAADLHRYIRALRDHVQVPLTGYGVVSGTTEGVYGDGWTASRVKLQVRPLMAVTELLVRARRPAKAPAAHVTLSINGKTFATEAASEDFKLSAKFPTPVDDVFEIEIVCDGEGGWAAAEGDKRDLAFVLQELRLIHPSGPRLRSIASVIRKLGSRGAK